MLPLLRSLQLQEVNPNLQGTDTGVVIQPGTRIAIPPFSDGCGDGERVHSPRLEHAGACVVAALTPCAKGEATHRVPLSAWPQRRGHAVTGQASKRPWT